MELQVLYSFCTEVQCRITIGRLVSEKDIDENREICYTYDDSGNILTKTDNGTITDYRYKDGTDRLMSFGTELFAYDDMGNSKTYRNMSCVWEKGRQLKSISDGANTVSFTYDEFGIRTSKTAGGITTNYVYENGKLLREVRKAFFLFEIIFCSFGNFFLYFVFRQPRKIRKRHGSQAA